MKTKLHFLLTFTILTLHISLIRAQSTDVLEVTKINGVEVGANAGDGFGCDVTPIGDLNGDGITDLAVGSFSTSGSRGAIQILFMNEDATVSSSQTIGSLVGGLPVILMEGGLFGGGLSAIGDLDNDGVIDLAVGAPYANDGGDHYGQVWILFMNIDGTVKDYQIISATEGDFLDNELSIWSGFGRRIANIGDLDQDGINEIAVGAFTDRENGIGAGALYILFLNSDGTVKMHQRINNDELEGVLQANDFLGTDLVAMGDLNDDGFGDLAVSVRGDDDQGPNRGGFYFLYLSVDGKVLDETKIVPGVGGLAGIDSETFFSDGMGSPGDINGDGTKDLLVGSFHDNDGEGAAWIIYLNEDQTVQTYQRIEHEEISLLADDLFSYGMSGVKVSTNPTDEKYWLAIGAPGDDQGGFNNGCIYLLETETLMTPVNEIEAENISFIAAPNPGAGFFKLSLNSAFDGPVSYTVYDNLGKLINGFTMDKYTELQEVTVDLFDQPNGTYRVVATMGNKAVALTLIAIRP